jgi:hypothetical protein
LTDPQFSTKSPRPETAWGFLVSGLAPMVFDFYIGTVLVSTPPGQQDNVGFPLILTFSLGEKEQDAKCSGKPDVFGIVPALERFLPLPKGEGRGEGESVRQYQHELS